MKSLLQRLVVLLCVSQIFVLPVLADELINISDIKGCRAISGDTERLACYDTVIDGGVFNEQKLKQVQVESFGSSSLRKEKAPVAPAPVTEAGTASAAGTGTAAAETETVSEPKAAGIDTSVDRLSVTITRVKKDGSGIHYFLTSDGQVWKQRNASGWSAEVPFDAEIKKGLMSSFFLVNEGGKSTRVKRVK